MSNGIAYTLNQTAKARRLSIKVDSHGQVIVSAPRFVPKFAIARFVESARPWIEKQQLEQRQKPQIVMEWDPADAVGSRSCRGAPAPV